MNMKSDLYNEIKSGMEKVVEVLGKSNIVVLYSTPYGLVHGVYHYFALSKEFPDDDSRFQSGQWKRVTAYDPKWFPFDPGVSLEDFQADLLTIGNEIGLI